MPVPITIYPPNDLRAGHVQHALASLGLITRYVDGRLEARTAADWRDLRAARAARVRQSGTLTERILSRIVAPRDWADEPPRQQESR